MYKLMHSVLATGLKTLHTLLHGGIHSWFRFVIMETWLG